MNIPPVNLAKQYKILSEEVAIAVSQVLSSGRYIGGKVVTDFEEQFADYIGVKHCVSCNSGTDALYLALLALNIGKGDEVITTPFTFIATAEVISRVGAKPVFIDIDADTFNLDLNQIETAISPKTKAIIPVHLFGQPVDLSRIMAIAEKYHLWVIEDCAQATGAQWQDRKVGSIGHVGCFSFFPTKNLGSCGDGGALTTNQQELANKARMLKEHGSSVRYVHDRIGINSRLDAIQAAILQIKLGYLDQWNAQRREVASGYQSLLQEIPEIKLPQTTTEGESVWNQYTICLQASFDSSYRDQLREALQKIGVNCMV